MRIGEGRKRDVIPVSMAIASCHPKAVQQALSNNNLHQSSLSKMLERYDRPGCGIVMDMFHFRAYVLLRCTPNGTQTWALLQVQC